MDYKEAGVDIEAGDALVDWIKSSAPENPHHKKRLLGGIGGFAGLFDARFEGMKSPTLVAATDGIGTKLLLALEFDRLDIVGQDLVAMCVNDLVCAGAEPLFFLDYYATGRLDLDAAKVFISSIQQACLQSRCQLLGGETAEMPGLYQNKHFDAAGFCVGVVDKDKVLGAHKVKAGDKLLALKADGFHSNGFSLLRKLFQDDLVNFKDEFLIPTPLYVAPVLDLLNSNLQINAIANITGGGMDNLTRILPESTKANLKAWDLPPIYSEIIKRSGMSKMQVLTTLNCGVGMVLVVSEQDEKAVSDQLANDGLQNFSLGRIEHTDQKPFWEFG